MKYIKIKKNIRKEDETVMYGRTEDRKGHLNKVKKRGPFMNPDEVCEAYEGKDKITIIRLNSNTILFEGKAKALEFIGNLFLAQAAYAEDCGFDIGPKHAGNFFFTKKSTHGIYIHRLPCLEKEKKR